MSEELYWYARGYYDGRTNGSEGFVPDNPYDRKAYKTGYDVGVTDYAHFDADENEKLNG